MYEPMTSEASQAVPVSRTVGHLHKTAFLGLLIGALGSVGFMLRAGRHTPRFLLVLFIVWILSPFVALAWANIVSKRWPFLTRVALYSVSLIVALGSLAIYGGVISPPAGSPNAFVFVACPMGSWLLMILVLPTAALIAGKLSRRGSGA